MNLNKLIGVIINFEKNDITYEVTISKIENKDSELNSFINNLYDEAYEVFSVYLLNTLNNYLSEKYEDAINNSLVDFKQKIRNKIDAKKIEFKTGLTIKK